MRKCLKHGLRFVAAMKVICSTKTTLLHPDNPGHDS